MACDGGKPRHQVLVGGVFFMTIIVVTCDVVSFITHSWRISHSLSFASDYDRVVNVFGLWETCVDGACLIWGVTGPASPQYMAATRTCVFLGTLFAAISVFLLAVHMCDNCLHNDKLIKLATVLLFTSAMLMVAGVVIFGVFANDGMSNRCLTKKFGWSFALAGMGGALGCLSALMSLLVICVRPYGGDQPGDSTSISHLIKV